MLAYNHFTENFFLGAPGDALDTDDGSDYVNATANVLYEAGLFKAVRPRTPRHGTCVPLAERITACSSQSWSLNTMSSASSDASVVSVS